MITLVQSKNRTLMLLSHKDTSMFYFYSEQVLPWHNHLVYIHEQQAVINEKAPKITCSNY